MREGYYRFALSLWLIAATPGALADWKPTGVIGDKSSCSLQTDAISIFDGYGEAKIQLDLNAERLLVKTDSNIDATFEDLALRVDDNEEIPADSLDGEQNVVFSSQLEEMLPQFIRGVSVTVLLRFWPTYPPTGRKEAAFTLIGFTNAHNQYQACRGS